MVIGFRLKAKAENHTLRPYWFPKLKPKHEIMIEVKKMIPNHCREVGVKKVDFELTSDNIKNKFTNQKLYTATNFLVLHNGSNWAVCKVTKTDGFELFREVQDVEILSLPDDTAYVEDPEVDVLNPTKIVTKAESVTTETGAGTVIVKGQFDHISFSHNEGLTPLVVLETVPPNPPKLVKLVENVVYNGRLTQPVKLIKEFIKVDEKAAETDAESLVFPCHTSGLEVEGRKTLYLDELPALEDMAGKVVLVGCSLSDRIFKSYYHRKPEFVNICPMENLSDIQDKYGNTPVLIKCCKYKDDYEIEGNVIKVPWGTTTRIIEEALNEFFSKSNSAVKEG